MTVQELLEKLTQAISYEFEDDYIKPGITISFVLNEYYTSIVRWRDHSNRSVVHSAKNADLLIALQSLSWLFIENYKPKMDPVQDLQNLLNV